MIEQDGDPCVMPQVEAQENSDIRNGGGGHTGARVLKWAAQTGSRRDLGALWLSGFDHG